MGLRARFSWQFFRTGRVPVLVTFGECLEGLETGVLELTVGASGHPAN